MVTSDGIGTRELLARPDRRRSAGRCWEFATNDTHAESDVEIRTLWSREVLARSLDARPADMRLNAMLRRACRRATDCRSQQASLPVATSDRRRPSCLATPALSTIDRRRAAGWTRVRRVVVAARGDRHAGGPRRIAPPGHRPGGMPRRSAISRRRRSAGVGRRRQRSSIRPPLRPPWPARGFASNCGESDCLIAATDQLAAEVAEPETLGVLLTPHGRGRLCLANRLAGRSRSSAESMRRRSPRRRPRWAPTCWSSIRGRARCSN